MLNIDLMLPLIPGRVVVFIISVLMMIVGYAQNLSAQEGRAYRAYTVYPFYPSLYGGYDRFPGSVVPSYRAVYPAMYCRGETMPVSPGQRSCLPLRAMALASSPDSGGQGRQEPSSHGSDKDKSWDPVWGLISEIRLGAGIHDAAVVGRRKEDGIDLDAELLFVSPRSLEYIWSPRPTLGVHANIKHKDNTSQVYGGLTWEWWPLDPVFINFFFGVSYHNGKTRTETPNVKALGSLWLFRESLVIGWQTRQGVNLSVYVDHASNGMILAKKNEGIDTLGVRFGYRF